MFKFSTVLRLCQASLTDLTVSTAIPSVSKVKVELKLFNANYCYERSIKVLGNVFCDKCSYLGGGKL